MVQAPGDYPWSSYRGNGLGDVDPVLAPHPIYSALGETEDARRACYRSLFADEIPEADLNAIRDSTNGGFVLGNERFPRQLAAMVGRRTWPGKSVRPKNGEPDADQINLRI